MTDEATAVETTEATTSTPSSFEGAQDATFDTGEDIFAQDGEEEGVTESAEDDYSYMPEFYIKDGEPDFKGLAEAYKGLQKKLSEGRNYNAPESVEAYEFDYGTDDVDMEAANAFKAEALEAGLSKEQYQFVMNKYMEEVTKLSRTPDMAENALKEKWGDSFEDNLTAAKNTWKSIKGDEAVPAHLGNDPDFISFLADLSSEYKEDAPMQVKAEAATVVTEAELAELRSRPDRYTNPEVIKKISDYYKRKG